MLRICSLLVAVSCVFSQGANNANKWTGAMAGGDVFWANPAAKAWFTAKPAVVEKPAAVTLSPAEIRAAAIAKHTAALHGHNVNDVMWAVVPKPTPAPAPLTPRQVWENNLINHNTDDVYWALPAAMQPKPASPAPATA